MLLPKRQPAERLPFRRFNPGLRPRPSSPQLGCVEFPQCSWSCGGFTLPCYRPPSVAVTCLVAPLLAGDRVEFLQPSWRRLCFASLLPSPGFVSAVPNFKPELRSTALVLNSCDFRAGAAALRCSAFEAKACEAFAARLDCRICAGGQWPTLHESCYGGMYRRCLLRRSAKGKNF